MLAFIRNLTLGPDRGHACVLAKFGLARYLQLGLELGAPSTHAIALNVRKLHAYACTCNIWLWGKYRCTPRDGS